MSFKKTNEKIIGICGGVGPMAGVALHRLIIANTLTNGTDQDHLEVYHLSRSGDIPDRTAFLLGKTRINPADGVFRTVQAIVKAAELSRREIVVGIPCNTFHAPPIFDRFLQLIREHNIRVHVVHMLEETAAFIHSKFPGGGKIGLMSTTGTRKVRVYRDVLEPLGFSVREVPPARQDKLHDAIYNLCWGIKAVSPVTDKARAVLMRCAAALCKKNVQAIILGCTEIPLALPEKRIKNVLLIDPVLILARDLIRGACPEKLKPLAELNEECRM